MTRAILGSTLMGFLRTHRRIGVGANFPCVPSAISDSVATPAPGGQSLVDHPPLIGGYPFRAIINKLRNLIRNIWSWINSQERTSFPHANNPLCNITAFWGDCVAYVLHISKKCAGCGHESLRR